MAPRATLLGDVGRRHPVSLSLPVCFRGDGDSGLVENALNSGQCSRRAHDLPGGHHYLTGVQRYGFGARSWNSNEPAGPFERSSGPFWRRPGPFRAGTDQGLPAFCFRADRLSLPASADLLHLRRRGDRTLRPVGGRGDDAGAAFTLSSVWDLRARFRSALAAGSRALVSTFALQPLAPHQRRGRTCAAARLTPRVLLPCQAAHCIARLIRIA